MHSTSGTSGPSSTHDRPSTSSKSKGSSLQAVSHEVRRKPTAQTVSFDAFLNTASGRGKIVKMGGQR